MRAILAIAAIVVLGAGCDRYPWSPDPRQEQVLRVLKDPESAQWRDLKSVSDAVLCGEVNAKNAMGGYVGFARFISTTAGKVMIEGPEPVESPEPTTSEVLEHLDAKLEEVRRAGVAGVRPTDEELERRTWRRRFEERWRAACG